MNLNKIVKTFEYLALLILIGSITTACGSSTPEPDPSQILTEVYLTAVPPTSTSAPLPPSPTAEPPSPPEVRVSGYVDSTLLNLRTGPSTMHQIIRSYYEGEELVAKGKIPNGKWVLVEIGENHETGWMAADYIQWAQNPDKLPIESWPERLTLRGNAVDSLGEPIENLVVAAIWREDLADREQTEATTDENGEFIIYIPKEMIDQIVSVEAIGPNCGSRLMNDDCSQIEYFEIIDQFYITPPQEEPITFVYEKATAKIIGKVTTRGGWAIKGIVVFASREEDGADAQTLTNDLGEFTLAVGPGTWRVVAIRFIPYFPGQESEPAIIDISEGEISDPIYIIGPWKEPTK